MGSSRNRKGDPLGFASGLPLTRAEKRACREGRERQSKTDSAIIKGCRQMGIPLKPASPRLRALWARMMGESEDAA